MPAFLLAAAAIALAPTAAPAEPVVTRYAGLALDPTASRIATIDSRQARSANTPGHGQLVLRDLFGKVVARHDPCEACRYEGLAWSPDGRKLAFVASGNGTATLYVLDTAKGGPRRITSVKGLAATPRWSPDGSRIAFLATVDATKETGATQPGVRQVGLIGSADDSKRIAIVPASGGDYVFASPVGTFVYEYDWLPDGTGFVGTAAEGNGDNQWWVASLRAFPVKGAMRVIAAPAVQMNFPRVAPDGRSVAFVGGLMSDFGSVGGDVYTVPIAGGSPRNLTAGYKATFTSLAWRGQQLVAGVTAGGSTGTAIVDPASGVGSVTVAPVTIEAGDGRVSLDRAGTTAALVSEGFATAPHIEAGLLGRMHAITHDNDGLASPVRAQEVRWRNEGHDVQGWLLAPAGPAPAGAKAPLITIVHGGPAAAVTPRFAWSGSLVALAARGYWTFQPNPRGSYGQGEAFVRANVKDFGGGDLRDILAGIDQVEKVAPIDDARLGITGVSYGGLMTMWTVTQTHRFKAAVAGAGISDWVAYYGQNGIDQWMIPYFGASAYDDPKTYDRLSPIRYIRNAKTPTFIYVGELDVECPPAQSIEFWHGLRAMGVPTALMIYEGEGHGLRQPAHIADRDQRVGDWFDTYLK